MLYIVEEFTANLRTDNRLRYRKANITLPALWTSPNA